MLIVENKLKNGKEQTVFVNTNKIDPTQVSPSQDPTKMRDKLMHQMMKTELGDIISTCKEIGNTDGKGGGNQPQSSGIDSTATDAQKSETKAVMDAHLQAQQASMQAKKVEATEKLDPKEKIDTDPSGGSDTPKPYSHDYLKNHNLFFDLLQISMNGNSSIYSILTEALAKNSALLKSNQDVTNIVTKINNDLQDIAANTGDSLKAMEDLQHEVLLLQAIGGGSIPPDATPKERKEILDARKNIDPDTLKQIKKFGDDINYEAVKHGGGFTEIIDDLKHKDYTSFDAFRNDMVNQSGTKSPGEGPTGIYTESSSLLTTLNTAGSQYMAQQNLQTKQIDQIEKLWTSGMTTEKGINQSVVGNIAN